MIAESVSTEMRYRMIEGPESARQFGLGFWRQNNRLLVIALVLGPLIGFLLSYAFQPKYTSQAVVLVQNTASRTDQYPAQEITRLWQVLSQSELEPLAQENSLRTRRSGEQALEQIRANTHILPVPAGTIQNDTRGKEDSTKGPDVAAFYVQYTASGPTVAQQICNQLTFRLLQGNLNSWQPVTETLADTLRQLDDAKRNLDSQQARLASFNNEHASQPVDGRDEDEGVLLDLNGRHQQISRTIKQAQEDKSHTASLLAGKVIPKPKPEVPPVSTAALEKQLSRLQSQLIQLEAQYTDTHPDVLKTKADISDVQKQLAELNEPESKTMVKSKAEESPEVRQLRLQIEHDDAIIADARREQKRIQEQIKTYQRRENASSAVEKQQRRLQQKYDVAQSSYDELLDQKTNMKNKIGDPSPESEMIRLLRPANLPIAPSFPNRMLFAATGLLVSTLGSRLAFALKVRHTQSLRTGVSQPSPGRTA